MILGRAPGLALAALALLVAGFVAHAALLGWQGLSGTAPADGYLFAGPALAHGPLSLHMIAGAAITALVPLQLAGGTRRRWPALHRWTGRLFVALAGVTSLGGLAFIAVQGSIAGPWMDFGFALYGVWLALAAAQTIRHARAGRFGAHRRWALRLAVLALASWLFRVHYGLWYLATGGWGSTAALDGPFDRVQVLAFFLPYMALLELAFRRGWLRADPPDAPHSRSARHNRPRPPSPRTGP